MTPEESETKGEDTREDDQAAAASGDQSPDGGPAEDAQGDGEQNPSENEAVMDTQAQAAEYLEGWQRARAEFSNYKKRVDRELQDAYSRAAGDVITRYLTILDDLERALQDVPKDEKTANWAQGIDLIYRKMKAMIEAEGVEVIEAEGQPFDPNLHEAISHEESDELKGGYIIDVVQQGYRMGDRVLRPAMVRVAK